MGPDLDLAARDHLRNLMLRTSLGRACLHGQGPGQRGVGLALQELRVFSPAEADAIAEWRDADRAVDFFDRIDPRGARAVLAAALGLPVREVAARLVPDAGLIVTGLVRLATGIADIDTAVSLADRALDLLTQDALSADAITRAFAPRAPRGTLELGHFEHLREEVELVRRLLARGLAEHAYCCSSTGWRTSSAGGRSRSRSGPTRRSRRSSSTGCWRRTRCRRAGSPTRPMRSTRRFAAASRTRSPSPRPASRCGARLGGGTRTASAGSAPRIWITSRSATRPRRR